MTATRQHENRAENRNENREEYRDDAPSTTLPVTYTRTLAPEQVESSALPDSRPAPSRHWAFPVRCSAPSWTVLSVFLPL